MAQEMRMEKDLSRPLEKVNERPYILCTMEVARAEPIRGHELPTFIVTFDGLTLPYGFLGL